MPFIEVKINLPAELSDIFVAELVEVGYDSFLEVDNGLDAYIEEGDFNEQALQDVIRKYSGEVTYTFSPLENKNWNEEWEKNFEPVIIDDKCVIRATFHKIPTTYEYEVVINPKMSFGTGHHETTSMMASWQLKMDFVGKRVMDAGSGTGILAILAEKRGAREVIANDIEEWAYNNCVENIALNNCSKITCLSGEIGSLGIKTPFDIILANINKNVLLSEMSQYGQHINSKGLLLLSGFYSDDVQDICDEAAKFGFSKMEVMTKNNWASVLLQQK
ncbi:MAG TPA: 50S ribosomal protein L11 methyltransferase [Cytophagaceae bacterium]|jgi:ribosomal protein L11 methyltransferase